MEAIFRKQLEQTLIEEEGVSDTPYFDSLGFVTYGVGHNLDANPLTHAQRQMGISWKFNHKFAMVLLAMDIEQLEQSISDAFNWVLDLPPHQRLALYLMAFQMGVKRMRDFEPTWKHLRAGELELVKQHLSTSLWAKQTPERAKRVINLMTMKVEDEKPTNA